MKNFILLFASIIFLSSCSHDEPVVPDYLDPVRFPLTVQPYLKSFLKEGNDRGVYLDINKLRKIVFQNNLYINNIKVAGYYQHANNTIYLDSTGTGFTISEDSKERVIFHELGHALLKREHRDDMMPRNFAASIMHSNCGTSYVTMPYMTESIHYRRGYYIDELFHPETPFPNWGY